ncbi:MAG: hypothetical protein HPY73_06105 [Methanomassiliicoccales archaeon]|nr:MAG: hypothetical protein HPY73_06105 [Methanomassiliicoccales archaeon]
MWGRTICPRCRRYVSKEQLYCPHCGTNLHSAYRPTLQTVTDKRMGQSYEAKVSHIGGSIEVLVKFILALTVVFGLLFLLFFAYLLYSTSP